MKLRSKLSSLLLIAAVLFFTSCGKTNKEGRMIPANAGFVVHLNGQSLNSKLPWEEIKQSELFKQVYADSSTPSFVKLVMDNPENTGIDIKSDVLIFAVSDSAGRYVAVEGTLKDAAKFKTFNSSVDKVPATLSEKDGIHYLSSNRITASWKDDKFIYVMDVPELNSKRYKYNADSFDSTGNYVAPPEVKQDLNAIATKIFDLKEDNSLGKDEKFTDLVKTTGDIHFWVNVEALDLGGMNMPGSMEALKMINLNKMYEGSRTAATVNFDNGKINADIVSYSGKEMTDLVKKYSGSKVDMEMLKRIPSKDLAGLFALNFKPEGIREYLKLLGVDGYANMGVAMLGFSVDDFIKANKGDILLAVSNISRDSNNKPNFSVLFSASVGDKEAFNKLINAGKKLGSERFMGPNSPAVSFAMSENYFAIGNNKEDVNKYIASPNNSTQEFYEKIAGGSSGAYINFQYIMKSMRNMATADSTETAAFDASLKMWDNLITSGTGFHNGGSSQHIEINLVDKNVNSLKQLHSYLNTMGLIFKNEHERNKNIVPPAVDSVKLK